MDKTANEKKVEDNAMKILIGADLVPTTDNLVQFKNGDIMSLVGKDLKKLLGESDYTLMNLETPLSDNPSPINKLGPALISSTAVINGIKAINPHFFTLANNHIMDQGTEGLRSTINCLKNVGIAYCGIGEDLAHMSSCYEKEWGGVKLGIYCCAEHEFSIATDTKPGANPFDPLVSFNQVNDLHKECDYVIVLYHGGKEFYRYPSPLLQKVFRKFADAGANLVIAQHTHCIGCFEKYNGATLVYGQGNFLFNKKNDEYWNTSLLIGVDIASRNQATIKYIPVRKNDIGVEIAEGEDAQEILSDFYKRSKEITDSNTVRQKYEAFAESKFAEYSVCFAGNRFWLRLVRKLFGNKRVEKLVNKRNAVRLYNFIECEAHRELYLTALRKRI